MGARSRSAGGTVFKSEVKGYSVFIVILLMLLGCIFCVFCLFVSFSSGILLISMDFPKTTSGTGDFQISPMVIQGIP